MIIRLIKKWALGKLILALFFLITAPAVFAQSPEKKTHLNWKPSKNSPATRTGFGKPLSVWQKGSKSCFIYDQFIVLVEPFKEDAGAYSAVYERNKLVLTDQENCDKTKGTPVVKSPSNGLEGVFAGLVYPYVMFDDGTTNDRALSVFRLDTRAKVDTFGYYTFPYKIDGDQLINEHAIVPEEEIAKLKSRPPCPMPEENQLGFGWRQTFVGKLTIDLKKKTRSFDKIHCQYQFFE